MATRQPIIQISQFYQPWLNLKFNSLIKKIQIIFLHKFINKEFDKNAEQPALHLEIGIWLQTLHPEVGFVPRKYFTLFSTSAFSTGITVASFRFF
jgi:hypothetical protein